MVASEHPDVIEGRWQLIAKVILDYEEAAGDGSIDDNGSSLDE